MIKEIISLVFLFVGKDKCLKSYCIWNVIYNRYGI